MCNIELKQQSVDNKLHYYKGRDHENVHGEQSWARSIINIEYGIKYVFELLNWFVDFFNSKIYFSVIFLHVKIFFEILNSQVTVPNHEQK